MLGIDTEIGRLYTAKNYLYILVEIVYYTRVLFTRVLLPTTQRKEQTEENYNCFLEMRK
jgi:hypothetical protein